MTPDSFSTPWYYAAMQMAKILLGALCCFLLFSCTLIAEPPGEENAEINLHGITLSQESVRELQKMSETENGYVSSTLGKITQKTTKEDVLKLLGEPSRNVATKGVGSKLNWWVCIGESPARAGVWFSPEGQAIEVALHGNGKYYYRQHITTSRIDHQENILRLDSASLGTQSERVPTCQ